MQAKAYEWHDEQPWASPGGGKIGICPFLEIVTKNQNFLENLKSAD